MRKEERDVFGLLTFESTIIDFGKAFMLNVLA